MLTELRIENFAIIDRLELHLKPGLVTFTGETGAGKSIIIDAVETLLGGRVDSTMIRSGSKNASIEATFQVTPEVRENVHAVLKREELLDDPDYFTLGREIRSEGRSVARLNGRAVNVGLLRELGELVVDVHGQSEHLSLLRVREHLGLLDRYVGAEDLLLSYSITYRQLMSVRKEMQELRIAESEAARRIDLLTYQINEIESARLQPGEEEDLRSERTRLANAETLASLAQKALTNLDEGTPEAPSVVDLFGQVMDALQDLARIDPSHSGFVEDSQSTFSGLTDLARDLRSYFESIEFNPKRLDEVEERIGLLQNLKRKYGDSISGILNFAANARQQMETIQGASERLAELAEQETNLLNELGERGKLLSQKRKQAADQLNQEMEAELADLRMSGARFSVDFQQRPDPDGVPIAEGSRVAFDSTGLERVEFLIAPNPGEGLKPLVRIASGGETSRLMLSLKNVLARADNISTLIFDEIDQGIGGRVGSIVGYKLWRLARHHQVLCITHLPQLAAFGEQHLQVQKHLQDGRTITSVVDLRDENRLRELAVMLGEVSSGTLHSAREMLDTAHNMTGSKTG